MKEIVYQTSHSCGFVRAVVRGGRTDIFRYRMSLFDPFLATLEIKWAAEYHNGAALWRELKTAGFAGGLRVVTEWVTRRRKEEGTATGDKRPRKAPSARGIARMMTTERDKLSKTVAHTVAIVEAAVPGLTTV